MNKLKEKYKLIVELPLKKLGIDVMEYKEEYRNKIDNLLFQINYFLNNEEHDTFAEPLTGIWATYYNYLTGEKPVNFV